MDNIFYISAGRQLALQNKLAIAANNIANMGTAGFKSQIAVFNDVRVQGGEPGIVNMVQEVASTRNYEPGSINFTGSKLDAAINGEGFFAVQSDQGVVYSRNGHFMRSQEGFLTTAKGWPVLDASGGVISLSESTNQLEISKDGTMSDRNGPIATLGLFTFDNVGALVSAGETYFQTDQPPLPVENPQIAQGRLEQSNVQPILEMTQLIEITRAFENTQKLIETRHEIVRKLIEQTIQN